jgi:hypothetical protein
VLQRDRVAHLGSVPEGLVARCPPIGQEAARALYTGAVPRVRKLYLDDVAALTGLGVSTLRGYRARGAATMPAPDGTDVDAGHARPWWWESTITAWMAGRRGKDWRKGQTGAWPKG